MLSTFLLNRWLTVAHADCGVETATGHWESPILQVIESNPALFHVLLRQLYARGRYPKQDMKAKTAARTPRMDLGETGSSCFCCCYLYDQTEYALPQDSTGPLQKPQPITSQIFCQTTKGNGICFYTYYLAGGSRPLCKAQASERPQRTGYCSSLASRSPAGKKGDALSF